MLSRVADSLYWMSRYIERAENNARIADVNLQLLLDLTNPTEMDPHQQWDPIISSLEEDELFASLYDKPDGKAVIDFVSLQKKNPNSIYSCLAHARENARTTSEQISSEMWEQINRLYLFVKSDTAKKLVRTSPYEFFKRIIAGSHLFQGITDATMTHGEGWDFIRIGKLLERADCTSRILDVKYHILLPSGEKVGGNVDTIQWMSVLKSCSALEAYRKIYVGQVAPWRVAEFIITHSAFPRSIRFSVDCFDAALHHISGSNDTKYANEAERLSGRLRSDLDYVTIGDIFKFGLHEYLEQIQDRLAEISSAMHASLLREQRAREFSLRIEQGQIPAEERFAEEHPDQSAEGEVGTERQLGRPDALADEQRRQADERPEERAGKDAEQDRAPAQEGADGREEFQVAASHRFARNLQLAHDAGYLVHGIEQDFFVADRDPVVVKAQVRLAEIATVNDCFVAKQE